MMIVVAKMNRKTPSTPKKPKLLSPDCSTCSMPV